MCLIWVDKYFVVHEDFIGLHYVPNITTYTTVGVPKDTLLQRNLDCVMVAQRT